MKGDIAGSSIILCIIIITEAVKLLQLRTIGHLGDMMDASQYYVFKGVEYRVFKDARATDESWHLNNTLKTATPIVPYPLFMTIHYA